MAIFKTPQDALRHHVSGAIERGEAVPTVEQRMPLPRLENGALPAYAWPGAYPLYYLFADGGTCCPDCANGKNGSEASETTDDAQWRLVACEVHWEGEPLTCDHCNKAIESAYGIPEN